MAASRLLMAVRSAVGVVLFVLLPACPQAPRRLPPPPPWAPAPTAQPPVDDGDDVGNACREQVAGLQDWLRSVENAGLPLAMSPLDDGARLVSREGPAIVDPAPLVHVSVAKSFLDGIPIDSAGGLQQELTELIELRRNMMPESPFIKSPRCYLAVDSDVPWSRLVAVVQELAAAGVQRVTFVFGDPKRSVPGPPPSMIDRELQRMSKSAQPRRAQITAELMAYVYQDCADALKVIASMGVNPVHDFKQVILDELPAAIGDCGCAPDDASVKALHWALFGNPRPTSGVTLRVSEPEATPASTLELAPEQTWADAHAQVVIAAAQQDEQPVRFAALAPAPHKKK